MKPMWTAGFGDEKKRLDLFLSEKVEGLTRSQAKRRIESGGFLVNGKRVSGHHFLKEGDAITEAEPSNDSLDVPRASHAASRADRTEEISPSDLRIIEETKDWIVVYKPVNILMHPDHDHPSGTLIDAVIAHAPEVAKVGEDPSRPGIMSRLDKDVSGLVVIAKTQSAFDDLKHQFAEHSVVKRYAALVYGEMEQNEGDIRFRIGRSESKARMAAFPETSENGQAAWTHYEVVKRFEDATLLSIQILTGRTHQIRAHVHALRHSIVGDVLYKPKQIKKHVTAPRLLLQSTHLEFTDPVSHERRIFDIPIDADFQAVLDTL